MKGIFFYSTECENCGTMWKIMEKEQFLQYFEKINIDKISIEQLKNLGITQVPALLISYPNGQRILKEASESFKWLNDLIQNRRASITQMINSNRVKLLEKNKQADTGNIIEFSGVEMQGISDDYAYLDADIPQPKNFLQCGQEAQSILTFNEGSKITEEEIGQKITQVKNQRNTQGELFQQQMRIGQLEAVYDNKMIK